MHDVWYAVEACKYMPLIVMDIDLKAVFFGMCFFKAVRCRLPDTQRKIAVHLSYSLNS